MIGTLTSSSPINPTPISNFLILEPSTSIEIINDKRLLKGLMHGVKCLAYSLRYAHSYNQTIGKLVGMMHWQTRKKWKLKFGKG